MGRTRITILSALALLTAVAASVSQVDNLRNTFYTLEHEAYRNISDPDWAPGLGDVALTKVFVAFDARLQALPRPRRIDTRNFLWRKVGEHLQTINGFYDHFVAFMARQVVPGAKPSPTREWYDLAEASIGEGVSVRLVVEKLAELMEHGDLFRSILQQEQADLCELQLSPHQVVYDMYNTIALAEIKAYAMMQFSWMLLRVYARGNYSQEANLTRKRYAERTARTAALARSALTMARRDVYRCNPDNHVAGETYAEVTRLLQGYIENEVDLNGDGTCKENCPYYTVAASHSCYDPHGYCNVQKRCTGRIVNCQYIDSDMWVCPASRSNNRRYEFIEYENGRVLGKPGHCRLGTTKVDSWWRWLFWHCSYCMCLCDEPGPTSDRYFSLWSSTSDVKNNKVVTGVRLVKHGQVFHLQVSEGHLGPRGNVTPGGWVPVQRFAITDKGVREGEDYHTLTYERRAIDLDELEAPVGRVLTGVRFRMIGAHLHFEIRATMFNYTTGRLAPLHSEWISNDNTDVGDTPRKKLELIRPDIPIRGNVPLQIDSAHDQFVEFTHSDLDADAAQSTVPFLDIQPVQPARGAGLLTGAGVYHRGALHSGGFLGLKVISYDMTRHIRADPPPAGYDDDDEESNVLPSDVQ
ncbi:uncharacterized protein LOC121733355 isoform X3 [Aricia agestis]|uniref:uncharacterized protein LOC121733355 isoform X3 n=1 Tax=Aricia agestis TaxID=91739 RepID=UPI001C2060AE|nr:uncharacterized protein LOC121733355 isoform X3 [Aricia agestis]